MADVSGSVERSSMVPGRGVAALALAMVAASVAVGGMGLGLSGPISSFAAAVCLVAALYGGFVIVADALDAPAQAKMPPPASSGAMLITDRCGTRINTNAAFDEMMADQGAANGSHGIGKSPQGAAALFALRSTAVRDGHAEGVLPDGTIVRVTSSGDRLVHLLERPTPGTAAPEVAFDTLVAAIPAPTAVTNQDGTILAANDDFRTVVGDGDRLEGLLALDRENFSRLAGRAMGTSQARLDAALKADPDRLLRLTAKRLVGDQLIVSVSDVTRQSALEAHMAQSQKMQAIGQLAGGIAHDFNNVLTAIIGFSDLLLQSHRPSDPAFRDIMNIKQSAQRAAGLVKQLLAFSRRQTLRPTVLNLNDVLADLSVMLDRLIGEPIRLEIHYGRDLWAVLADLSQLEQVIINLAVNARDAMPGGGRLTIRTSNVPGGSADLAEADAPQEDAVLVEIEDVGTGMPQHVLEKIFEPFFTTKATGEGTGLGLSTVYGIVKQTGGSLTVSSKEGAGTTFRVYLPRTAAAARVAVEAQPGDGGNVDLTGNATLVLAEDEEAIRTFAARALSAKGYQVLAAADGAEALKLFAEHGGKIDLLLTDVIMPELDGPSLVRTVRAERPDMKVIFMSGYADGASVDDLGSANFLAKPFTLKDLAEAVKRELGTAPATGVN